MEDKPERAVCGARKRQGEGVCQRPAGWGTSHPGSGNCKLHTGATTNGAKAAVTQMVFRQGTLHAPVERPDPVQVLLDELWRSAAVVAWLEAEVLGMGVTDLNQVSASGISVPAFMLKLYQDERDRLAKSAALCVSAGLAERQLAVAEGQARTLAVVIRQILGDLHLSPAQEALVPNVVRARMGALSPVLEVAS